MLYEELQQRYGNHIAKRVQRDLSRVEFNNIPLENLPAYLEQRAEKAAVEYKTVMDNPLDRGGIRSEEI